VKPEGWVTAGVFEGTDETVTEEKGFTEEIGEQAIRADECKPGS